MGGGSWATAIAKMVLAQEETIIGICGATTALPILSVSVITLPT